MKLTIKKNILTKNDCYKSTRVRNDTNSVEVHSIGTAQNSASALASYWNQSGIQACVHYCVDAETEGLVYQFLPESKRAWADGGHGNSNSITFEIMESDYMKYTGGANYTITDQAKFLADINRGYNTAVLLTAKICKEHGWNPLGKMSNGLHRVYSHNEARKLGLATSHVDPDHIWSKINKSMDTFRQDVKKCMSGNSSSSTTTEVHYYRVRKSWADEKSQTGAYESLDNAKKNCQVDYSVFDDKGNAVYTNAQKTTSTGKYLSGKPSSKQQYIDEVAKIAMELYPKTKILPSVVIGQCCIETGYGLGSDSESLVAVNNLLGMKSDLINSTWKEYTVWNGEKYKKHTPEYYNGKLTYIDDYFRVYTDYKNCIEDYEMFLLHVKNDKGLKYAHVAGMTDPEKVITAISKGGYATDPVYITKVMKLIKENDFTKYDKQVIKNITTSSTSTPIQTPPQSKTTKTYRVQVSACSVKKNANNVVKTLKSKGFAAFIEKEKDNQYHVYCGSYGEKKNAENRVNELAKVGQHAIVKEV